MGILFSPSLQKKVSRVSLVHFGQRSAEEEWACKSGRVVGGKRLGLRGERILCEA